MRLGLSASWRPADWLAFVGEIRSEDFEHPSAYAAYVRVRPWRSRAFDIQAGRIPPTFGAFGRHAYGTDNPVIGYPLAYQYLTSLRTDAVPATADDLLAMRARGWKSSFPVGSQTPGPGVPLVTAFQWDTGVQVRWKQGPIRADERSHERHAVEPETARRQRRETDRRARRRSHRRWDGSWASPGARGAWLAREIPQPNGAPLQRALGADAGILARPLDRAQRGRLEPVVVSRPARAVQRRDCRRAWHVGRRALPHHAARVPRGPRRSVGVHAVARKRAAGPRAAMGRPRYANRSRVSACTCSAISCCGRWRRATGVTAGRVHDRTFVSAQFAYWF